MSDLLDELTAHGFEIVRDESGQDLVKLVFMDENDEASGYALLAPEDAKRIISGQATLQNVLDEEGKQVLTLAPVQNAEGEEYTQITAPSFTEDSVNHTENDGNAGDASQTPSDFNKDTTANSAESNIDTQAEMASDSAAKVTDETLEQSAKAEGEMATSNDTADVSVLGEGVEQYTLSEQTALINNKPIQVVTLVDAQGQVLDQKQGQAGDQVILEMHGQAFSYEIQGPTETGEPITSTLLVSSAEGEEQEMTNGSDNQDIAPSQQGNTQVEWSENSTMEKQDSVQTAYAESATDAASAAMATPAGQQFTLTEAVAMLDGETVQTVILTDENGTILDQKQGHTGDHVIIEMNGSSLEYVFLGPTETGEPITTTLVVTTEPETSDSVQPNGTFAQESPDESEAGLTVAKWCPTGLPSEFYAILRRQVEVIVATRLRADSNAYRPEPYHRKLGTYPAYLDMVRMVNTYQVGASQGETLELYEQLRNYAKIYRPSGPQSRALNKYELALNEAAAQICRFQPGLLFHKRELFRLAKEAVEQSQTLLNTERRQQNHQLQMQQQAHAKQNTQRQSNQQTGQNASQKPKVSTPVQQPTRTTPPTVAVGGRVASSQLAMLESRGLSAMQQPATPSLTPAPSAVINDVPSADVSAMPGSLAPTSTASGFGSTKSRIPPTDGSMHYLSSLPMVKRDSVYKLLPSEEEAIRAAALDVLSDLPRVEVKLKADCTNIERACWEQARQLTVQIPDHAPNANIQDVASQLQSLVANEVRVESVRESAALYGRPPGGIQPPNVTGLPRSGPVPVLTPYEVACNEAAAYLASGLPSLLTHRRELAELAKKVVRNSGCVFTHTPSSDKVPVGGGGYRFYCTDQLPELDLSAAEQLLSDPLDRSDSPDSGCGLSPNDSSETDALATKCESLSMSCQECNNVIDDITIYAATGTDSLKKVRILNLSDCGFTGLIPMHLNQCANLVELNLSGNAFYAFPRCLHLPKLRRLNLRGNPNLLRPNPISGSVEPPLVEQFPRLVSLDLDPQLASLLSPQALAYLCPYLKTVNGQDFNEEPSEESINAAQSAKNSLSTLIYSKWEDDIAGFYKKGLPKRDTICVIETLVLHAVNRSVDIVEPFTHCKSILARRIAEDFLAPKMLDDECEDETSEKIHPTDASEDEGAASDSDLDAEDDDDYAKDTEPDAQMDETGEVPDTGSDLVGDSQAKDLDHDTGLMSKSRPTSTRRKPKKLVCSEAAQASVAEREAEAAAANLALLPDEPPDRLINVVGQALRHGKTVVYAVMRTAARQPNGELIPVGGLASATNTTPSIPTVQAVEHTSSKESKATYEDEFDESDTENTPVPEPVQQKQPPPPPPPPAPKATKAASRQSASGAVLGTRRPGLLNRATSNASAKTNRAPIVSNSQRDYTKGVTTIQQRKLQASDYIIRPSTSASESAYIVPSTALQQKSASPWAPGRRGRPPVSQSMTKKAAAAQAEAAETTKLIQNVPIPPPHAPPPPTMRMSTRDSNRHKRFSAYGVIDTAAALAGKEEALLAAALAFEDEEEAMANTPLLPDSSVVLSETDTAAAEAAVAKAKEAEEVECESEAEPVSSAEPVVSVTPVADTETPLVHTSPKQVDESGKKKRRRPAAPSTTSSPTAPATPTPTPTRSTARKRTGAPLSPKSTEPKRKPAPPTPAREETPAEVPAESETKTVKSLSELGEIVDYDPLHFIRCHARDNDPLDCETKVWRCAFEPSVNDPHNETSTVVATCGGECVCLIDCQTGRVMKRFKHFDEQFYTLAWTTVEIAPGHKTNLLAAAGKLREIRLLHPEQLVCYAEMRGHKDDVACMIFHPKQPTILFSGDSKACILVWDIGIPSAPEYRTRHQLLMRLVCPRPNLNPVLNLVFLPKYDALIAGCEDGIFSWTLKEFRKEKLNEEKEAELELKVPTRREPCFDGLAKLTEDLVVTKCVEEGEIYVFDYSQVLGKRKRTGTNKNTISVEIRGQLRWQTTEEIYINVTARQGLHAVICGDNEGTIWLYDLQKQVSEYAEGRKFKAKPVKILEWPECSIGGAKEEDTQLKESITSGFKNPVVNTTDISYDGQYLAAVTDNNLVCIWKFSG